MYMHYVVFLLLSFVAVTALADPADNNVTTILPLVVQSRAVEHDNDSSPKGLLTQISTSLVVEEKSIAAASNLFFALQKDIRRAGRVKKVAREMQSKIRTLTRDHPSAKMAYHTLHLDKVKDENLFQNTNWELWAVYVGNLHKEDPDGAIIEVMSDQLGVSHFVAMIIEAIQDPATEAMATKLEKAQIQHWLDNLKAPVDAFRELNIQNHVNNMLSTPLYPFWSKYVKAYQQKYPNHGITELGVIRTFFHSDLGLLKMLTSANNLRNPASMDVLYQFAPVWVKSETTPEEVFGMVMSTYKEIMPGVNEDTKLETIFQMMLNEKRDTSPLLILWVDFMIEYSKKNVEADPTINEAFKMLFSSGNNRSNGILRTIKNEWLAGGVHPLHVFVLFKLDKSTKGLFSTPLGLIYRDYLIEFSKLQ